MTDRERELLAALLILCTYYFCGITSILMIPLIGDQ